MDKIKVSIVGITGYTGLEILRLCLAHPYIDVTHLTSRNHEKTSIGNIYPHLAHLSYEISNISLEQVAADSDVVFLALPHKTAQDAVAQLHKKVKLIDLSADYRLDEHSYNKYYGEHKHPELLQDVIYGLPELYSEDIKKANTVANPGCFALLGQILLAPFKGKIDHADLVAITGSSGSGKSPSEGTHHPIRSHNLKSYNINTHRHIPEILRSAGLSEDKLNFIPSSGPFTRGIFAHASIHFSKEYKNTEALENIIKQSIAFYQDKAFIRVLDQEQSVSLANINASNYCDVSFQLGQNNTLLAQGALDNLVKGAAGTAIQNMNLMFGLEESEGLDNIGTVYP